MELTGALLIFNIFVLILAMRALFWHFQFIVKASEEARRGKGSSDTEEEQVQLVCWISNLLCYLFTFFGFVLIFAAKAL